MFSRQALRAISTSQSRWRVSNVKKCFSQVAGRTTSSASSTSTRFATFGILAATTGAIATTTSAWEDNNNNNTTTKCDMITPIGPTVKEPATGILFPHLCNGLTFVGCGVRVKYVFVKVYAVGTYVDPIAMEAIKKETNDAAIGRALCEPMVPRTIRLVMNRTLSMEKYTAAIVDAIEPRLKGEELDKLEEFKKMNPPGDMVEGAEVQMTIRGDTFLYKNCAGGVGMITSEKFCRAICDLYYGDDPVSKDHKEAVIQGIKKL